MSIANGQHTVHPNLPAVAPLVTPVTAILSNPPGEPDPRVYHGLAGSIVNAIAPHTEAALVAILVQLLAAFGLLVGRTAHFAVEGDTHYPNLYVGIAGPTSKGRKGVSWGRVRSLFDSLGEGYQLPTRSGLVSGEGFLWNFDDDNKKVTDKRMLCVESELSRVFKAMQRTGSILSEIIRQFWQGEKRIESMARGSPITATDAHVAIIGHITPVELRATMSETDAANGFGNRFTWFYCERSKLLPEGGQTGQVVPDSLLQQLKHAIDFAKEQHAISFSDDARHVWEHMYHWFHEEISDTLAGAILQRGPSQIRRFAMIYALLDCSQYVTEHHLWAAWQLWEYSSRSVSYMFGNSLGIPLADDILVALQSAEKAGLSRDQIRRDVFNGHVKSKQLQHALGELQRRGLAHALKIQTPGRAEERWWYGPPVAS